MPLTWSHLTLTRRYVAFVSDEDHVLALDAPIKGARAEFLRDSDRKVVWLRIGGRILRRV